VTTLFGGAVGKERATALGRAAAGDIDVGVVTTTSAESDVVKAMAGLSGSEESSILYGSRGIFDRAITAGPKVNSSMEFERGMTNTTSPYRTVSFREFSGEAASQSGGAGAQGGRVTLRGAVDQMLEETESIDRRSLIVVYDDRPGRLQDARERGRALTKTVSAFDGAVSRGLEAAHRRDDVMVAVTAPRARTLSVLDNHYGFTKKTACGVAQRCGGSFELTELGVPSGVRKARAGWDQKALQGEYAPPVMFLQYAWPAQVASGEAGAIASANLVPVFAEGPGAEALGGTEPQRALGEVIREWSAGGNE
jgi:hypothetical protein